MRFKQIFLEGYDEKTDKYIPSEKEKREFGRVKNNYSKKKENKKDLKDILKELTKITNTLSSDISKKKYYELWYSCWKIDNDKPEQAIQKIKDSINKFNEADQKKILSVVNGINLNKE
jgi:uncharacterized protein YpuA (DUF1002 family)